MYFPRSLSVTLVLFFVLTLSACGSSSGKSTGSGNSGGDTTAPTAVVQPASGSLIQNTTIVILFNESMDTNPVNYSITGTMAVESDGGVWSQTTVVADTLTISPTGGSWSLNTNRTLVVNAKDLAGNPVSAISLLYDIVALSGTIYYVSSAALDDTDTGLSPATAKLTIPAAINAATAPASVLVNAGTYTVDSTPGTDTHVILKEGVSLYGSFSPDFTNRNLVSSNSTITDTGVTSLSGFNKAIAGSGAITSATIIEGFTINGSSPGIGGRSAIYLSTGASSLIKNNIINGGAGVNTHGIYNIDGSSPIILNNKINGGNASSTSFGILNLLNSSPTIGANDISAGNGNLTYAIANENNSSPTIQDNILSGGNGVNAFAIRNINSSSPIISGNTIYGGTGTYASAITLSTSSALIYNNLIHGGSATQYTTAIFVSTNSSSTIYNNIVFSGKGDVGNHSIRTEINSTISIANNIIFSQPASSSICIYESTGTGTVSLLKNNNFSNCGIVYFDANSGCTTNLDGDGSDFTCTLSEMEMLTDIPGGVSGNISTDPLLVNVDGADNDINTMTDNDWHFSVTSPASITAGGLNGLDQIPAWTFTVDKDGVTRPASGTPWSMGAYEP